MEAKLTGAPDKVSVRLYLCGYPERIQPRKVENGERHIPTAHHARFDNVQDTLPRYIRYDGRNTLANRLRAGICELCGNKTDDIRMHHVRALKKLTGKTEAERLMLHMRRKSLALCPYCYATTLAQEP